VLGTSFGGFRPNKIKKMDLRVIRASLGIVPPREYSLLFVWGW